MECREVKQVMSELSGRLNKMLLTCILFSAIPLRAFAWPPTYGAEFSFTNDKLLNADLGPNGSRVETPENLEAREEMLKQLRQLCRSAGCRVPNQPTGKDRNFNKNYRIEFADGWWFDVSLDPGVVEVQTRPSTYAEYAQNRERLGLIFEAARKAELAPHPEKGGGHIHVGDESTFANNDRLFRNFVVDLVNHPEVVGAIFGKDLANSVPINSMPENLKKNFTKVVQAFDAGAIKSRHEMAKQIDAHVYKSLPWPFDPRTESEPNKYRALNFVRMDPTQRYFKNIAARTLELRFKRAQQNADDFLRQIALLDARLHVLNDLKRDIKLAPPRGFSDFGTTPEDYLRFQTYIVESGLDVAHYQDLIPTEFLARDLKVRAGFIAEAVQARERESWFSRLFGRKMPNSCRPLFAD